MYVNKDVVAYLTSPKFRGEMFSTNSMDACTFDNLEECTEVANIIAEELKLTLHIKKINTLSGRIDNYT